MATLDEIKQLLGDAGYRIAEEKRLPNDKGHQLKIYGGQIVNVYDNGTCQVQGRNQEAIKTVLAEVIRQGGAGGASARRSTGNVFVVYGHDQLARNQLDAMLRRWRLEPLFLDQLPSEGQTIIEKLEKYRQQATFAVVLATPDDEGFRAGREDERAYRARPNVVLELGMVLALLGRPRVAILLKGASGMERPSDIQGLIYIPFTENVEESAVPLAKEMNKQGYRIEVDRL